MARIWLLCVVALALCSGLGSAGEGVLPEGTGRIDFHGYRGCVKLENANCRVVLGHQCGGRVLEYSWKGTNVIALDEKSAGKIRDPKTGEGGAADGGRCDIGPENVIPRHPGLWVGPWTAAIVGPRAARLTSLEDKPTGVQLIREFRLDKDTSHLACTQIIKNVSTEPKHWCHWSRTFALGLGTVVIPLSAERRFPHGYVMYGPDSTMMYRPKDPNIVERDGHLIITGPPAHPKLGMDSMAGWFAYLMRNDLMFVKRYATFPDRAYNEMAALTISIWYPAEKWVELEPIGPRTDIAPGKTASFTEHWWILPHKYPKDAVALDLRGLTAAVEAKAR